MPESSHRSPPPAVLAARLREAGFDAESNGSTLTVSWADCGTGPFFDQMLDQELSRLGVVRETLVQ